MGTLLESIHSPADLKRLNYAQMAELAEEIREFLIQTLSKTGGHLGPNLGVVELTLALHAVFNTPEDKILFDVSHQAYIHKILTGRRERFDTIRQPGGLNGFMLRTESEHDCYGAGHAGTALSAALGMAVARDLAGGNGARGRRGRRRRLHQRHLLRGAQQHRRADQAPDRGAQRQRVVHRPQRGRHRPLLPPHRHQRALPAPARLGHAHHRALRRQDRGQGGAPRRRGRQGHALALHPL